MKELLPPEAAELINAYGRSKTCNFRLYLMYLANECENQTILGQGEGQYFSTDMIGTSSTHCLKGVQGTNYRLGSHC